MKCIHLIVSGRVQGVNFRNNTRRKAIELELNGYVRNLSDGNVEVVAQGDDERIKELINFIKNGPGIAKVRDIKIKHKELENFKNFEVRY